MPLFRRTPKPPPPPSVDLASGEEVERAIAATLLYDKQKLKGVLYMTNRRLLFEAPKGEARWMSVPYGEMTRVGLYAWPGASMGFPSSMAQCLVAETAKGEQIWWDFDERAEREWLPLVEAKLTPEEQETA